MQIPFDNSFAALPAGFYDRQDPIPVASPRLVRLNQGLARKLGLDPAALNADLLSGNAVPLGAEPLAMAYAGHQFGGFVPQLGDGRALLLGEVVSPQDGQRYDIQLKGSGRTAFSRGGDGRATLGAVLREYLVSEAMAALGIPTTRSLAVVTTGEVVPRDRPEPGAVLTRVAASHIRVGTFQYHFYRRDTKALQTLTDYVIARHYPEAKSPLDLLEQVMQRQAELVARWMGVGFIHGVMNTDNMAISGETIDYGPCAFMDSYHPDKVFSSIDRQGRYAFAMQPKLAHWNLAQLAGTLVPLVKDSAALQAVLDGFEAMFLRAYLAVFGDKLGGRADTGLIEDILSLMAANEVDFTLFFSHLTDAAERGDFQALRALFQDQGAIDAWLGRWGQGDSAIMRRANPAYIARNHQVEAAIEAANTGDFEPFEALHHVLKTPFTRQDGAQAYARPPKADEVVHATFCGT